MFRHVAGCFQIELPHLKVAATTSLLHTVCLGKKEDERGASGKGILGEGELISLEIIYSQILLSANWQ